MSVIDPWTIVVTGHGRPIDLEEVRRASCLLSDGRHELRALPSGRSRYVQGGDPQALADLVTELQTDRAIYWTLNPVVPGRDEAARNQDIERRQWLFLDIDPDRPADTCATDEEKDCAWRLASLIDLWSIENGWPTPVVVDSGNGCYLLYRIELTNDKTSTATIKSVLQAFDRKFKEAGAHIDTGVHNLSRIARLPGTWNTKGVSTPERPHRRCKLVYVPEKIEAVTYQQLQHLASTVGKKQADAPTIDPWTVKAGDDRKTAYLQRALEGELLNVCMSSPGHRNDQLNKSAFRLGQLTAHGLTKFEVTQRLTEAAKRCGLSDKEITQTVSRAVDDGAASPAELPASLNGQAKASTTQEQAKDLPSRLIIWAKDVTPKKVEWLWPGYIPLSKMTTFAGQGGLGKTFTLCDLASRISNGSERPMGKGECLEEGKVLFISGEDDIDDTLVPRLIQCGADLSQIAFLSPESEEHFSLASLKLLTAIADQMDGIKLVIVDPPSSYTADADDHKNSEVRGLLTPLKRWAAEKQASIIFNTHVNKATAGNVEAAARVMGSVAWVNAVRSAFMFTKDQEEKDRVLFTNIKMNLAAKPTGLAYRIEIENGQPRFEWVAEVDMDADEAVGGTRSQSAGERATNLLEEMFRRRRVWSSKDMDGERKAHGISVNAISAVRGKLKDSGALACKRIEDPHGEVFYEWCATSSDWPPEKAQKQESGKAAF